MRIAQIAPLYESCPPQLYGGTERVVSWLTEELVRQGHDVTLFASGDSRTAAQLVAGSPRALRLDPHCTDQLAPHLTMLDRVMERADDFDVLHFHTDYLHFPLVSRTGHAVITTLHGRLDLPHLQPLYDHFCDMPVVSISNAQRDALPQANWMKTVYHGLPANMLHAGAGDGGYLAFIGRISPEKRLDRAILIARAVGMKIKIAAKIDNADKRYFTDVIEPMMKWPGVEFVGEIGDDRKQEFLGRAAGLLFPIDWPEPFGLVMIEAMACGTPVLAFDHGSVPEVLDHGTTGMIVRSLDEAVASVGNLLALDRKRIRSMFETRFSVETMAHSYLRLYREMAGGRSFAIEKGTGAGLLRAYPGQIAAAPV